MANQMLSLTQKPRKHTKDAKFSGNVLSKQHYTAANRYKMLQTSALRMVSVLWDSTVHILIGEQSIGRKHNTPWKVLTCLLETSLWACTHMLIHNCNGFNFPSSVIQQEGSSTAAKTIYQKHVFPWILKLRNITYVVWPCFPGCEIYLQVNTHICGRCSLFVDSKIEWTRSATLEPKDAHTMCREHPCYPTAPIPWRPF